MSAISKQAIIIKNSEARNFMEGPEHCREYVRIPELWFGTSTLQPNQKGALDPGHPESKEVFFVFQGHILVYDENQYYELYGGDALLITEGLPHTITNVGTETAIIAWAGAPGE